MSLPIYRYEAQDGLTELLSSTACVAYEMVARPVEAVSEQIQNMVAKAGYKKPKDLYPLSAILASVGWNLNDDVFTRQYTFDAKDTPVDKPFNFMHEESDIIGHITGSMVLSEDGTVIDSFDNLPEKFDIAVSSVLYTAWADEARAKRMSEIIEGIAKGEWFVSMECLFSDFDYAIVTPDGEQKTIARNEESAFLTKHLRAYKGKGEYEGNKIGRLLKNFVFSGKGLVNKPANKRSIIFDFAGEKALANQIFKGIPNMNEVELLKAEVAKLQKQAEQAEAENKALVAKANDEAKKATEKEVAELKAKVAAAEEAAAKAEKASEESTKAVAGVNAELTKTREELATANKAIETAKAEALKTARIGQLVTAGATQEEAVKLVDKFASANDEMFAEIVALAEAKKDNPFDKKKDDKKDDKNAKALEATKSLEEAKVEETVNPATASDNTEVDETKEMRSKAAAWLSEHVFKKDK